MIVYLLIQESLKYLIHLCTKASSVVLLPVVGDLLSLQLLIH